MMSHLDEEDGDFDNLIDNPLPPFDENDVDYPLKTLSHHVRGMSASNALLH
jgi:hypothetical protein